MQRTGFVLSSAAARMTDHLLLAAAGCPQIEALIKGALLPAELCLEGQNFFHAVTTALAGKRVTGDPPHTLHLLAHGRPGAFSFADQWIDAETLKAHASDLAQWEVETIALWSCHVGADADFVALLEELTGAVVYSSQGWLGKQGGQLSLTLQRLTRERSASIEQLAGDTFFTAMPLDFSLGRKNKSGEDNNVGDLFFGIDDENNVWQVNPSYELFPKITQPFSKVLRLFDPIEGNTRLTQVQGANGIAFDRDNSRNENDTLYFFYLTKEKDAEKNGIQANNNGIEGNNDDGGNLKKPAKMGGEFPFNIAWWNVYKGEMAWDWLEWKDPSKAQNFGPLRNGKHSPNNAAFYGDSIWYFLAIMEIFIKLEYEPGESRRPLQLVIKYKI